jgi:parallel beta-helix repeat protein
LLSSSNNFLDNNSFLNNNYALRIKGSRNNNIYNNNITINGYGLYFCCGARDNIAYNNNFIENIYWNANDGIGNIWDNGIIGNYWDDYNGTDNNEDGIGDEPYIITGGKFQDNYPLLNPIE